MIALENAKYNKSLQIDRSMMKEKDQEEGQERKQKIGHYPLKTSLGSQLIGEEWQALAICTKSSPVKIIHDIVSY